VKRVLPAVSLMIRFYLFAILIALALLWIPYAEWMYGARLRLPL
jgi:hypothetical protein